MKKLVAVLFVSLSLGLAACGSGKDDGASGGSSSSPCSMNMMQDIATLSQSMTGGTSSSAAKQAARAFKAKYKGQKCQVTNPQTGQVVQWDTDMMMDAIINA